jgi:flagellin-specific chaperone FliS
MATNSPKHVNPRDVARLLGLSPSQVKARVRESASAQATARTSSRTNILMLNDDILGKVMGKYSELVNRPDITTQEERLMMLEHIVGKLESRLNSKQDFLNDISNGIGYDELISTYLKEANDILANVRKSIRNNKSKTKKGNKNTWACKKIRRYGYH